MKRVLGILAVAVVLGGSVTACENKEEAAKKAAADTAASAKVEADKAAAAKKDADEAAAKVALMQKHTDAKVAAQKELDGVDRKLTYLKDKLSKATGPAKKNGDTAMADFTKKHDAVKADIDKLGSATDTAWDAAKTDADRDVAALKQSLDALETAITGKPAH